MKSSSPKPKFYLSKKPGRTGPDDVWCRTWYDKTKRRMHHESLGTSDPDVAARLLADWVTLNDTPMRGRPDQVLMDQVLLTYNEKHLRFRVTAKNEQRNLGYWQKFYEGKTVAEVTPEAQEEFVRFLQKDKKLKTSSIDRVLSSGRAALNRAVKRQELQSAPHIFMQETPEERRSREPMGRPILPIEIAKILDAVKHYHIFAFVMIAANTLSRPRAIYDLRRIQFDPLEDRLNLNPPGRKQTKKYRPIVPVTPTLRPWLNAIDDPNEHYILFRERPINDVGFAWEETLEAAGVDPDLTGYSFRHGIARQMRSKGVPTDQISHFLGHTLPGSATTSIYAPFGPEYCGQATTAIQAVMEEVRSHMKSVDLFDYDAVVAELDKRAEKYLTPNKRKELDALLRSGATLAEASRKFGVTATAVGKRAIKIGVKPPGKKREKK